MTNVPSENTCINTGSFSDENRFSSAIHIAKHKNSSKSAKLNHTRTIIPNPTLPFSVDYVNKLLLQSLTYSKQGVTVLIWATTNQKIRRKISTTMCTTLTSNLSTINIRFNSQAPAYVFPTRILTTSGYSWMMKNYNTRTHVQIQLYTHKSTLNSMIYNQ